MDSAAKEILCIDANRFLLNYIVQVAQNRFTFNKEKLNNIYKSQADLFELRNMEAMLFGDMKMKNIELNTLMNIEVI
ncbi:MAG: hypothetical protein IPN61_09805 [Bacteroidetes bacterium]|nr:hypothetical protein [Bacteroidota bacterium]